MANGGLCVGGDGNRRKDQHEFFITPATQQAPTIAMMRITLLCLVMLPRLCSCLDEHRLFR